MGGNISILGSTGSIGVQTLDVARNLGLKVSGLAAGTNIDLLEKQIREFKPCAAAVADEKLAKVLRDRVGDLGTKIHAGVEGMNIVASLEDVDTVVASVVGTSGLIPTLEAIRSGKDIALANKETLVTAGSVVIEEALRHNVRILPVDSEHSAIFQCMMGNSLKDISKLIITASGGPFRGKHLEELKEVTPAQALKHPNWSMGAKITIDSSTLMNKGLEVIEAKWLFDVELNKIQVMVHPQSIIHSMVEFVDGSVMAQLGQPDMRIPIQLALTYPKREFNSFSRLNLLEAGTLTFEEPDQEAFPCLKLAYEAGRCGGTMPAVLNAANEIAVDLFIKEKIGFIDIPGIIENVMSRHIVNNCPNLEDIIEADRWARETAMQLVRQKCTAML
ncbi:MAG: 1-deoxy-D-xylulose-5-phosphate reductoisomerase [Clostridia bacterium]|nr:1-deoxy-D-xylulose-5-phosphate reductoisomerase [Clostridia bacterium]